jgi:hypothetical protein
MLRRIAERFANLVDRGAETVIEIDYRLGAPDLLAEFVPGDHFAGLIKKDSEKFEWLSLKLYANARLSEVAGGQIHLEDAKLKFAVVDRNVLDHGELR